MTDSDWPAIARLLAGWPCRADDQPDRGAYLSLLKHFEAVSVGEALRGMVGRNQYRPTASEIAGWIMRDEREDRRDRGVARLYGVFEARHRAAGSWLEPLVDPFAPVERGAS
jgi:hypothetical protein